MCLVLGVSLGNLANLRQALLSSYTLDGGMEISHSSVTISENDLELAEHFGVFLDAKTVLFTSFRSSLNGIKSRIDWLSARYSLSIVDSAHWVCIFETQRRGHP